MFDEIPSAPPSPPDNAGVPPPDETLQQFAKLRRYARTGKVPWRKVSSWKREDLCNSDLVTPQDVWERNGVPFPLRAHRFVTRGAYQDCLKKRFLPEVADAQSFCSDGG